MTIPRYYPIAKITVGSGGNTYIEFTSIPATYSDICIVYSLRSDRAGQVNSSGRISFNNDASNYSYKQLIGNGSTTGSGNDTNGALIYCPASTATGSTFGNGTVYIPKYAGNSNKTYSVDFVAETNATNIDGQGFSAGLWSSTSIITSVKIIEANGANFVQYSTATLYGIGKP
jgi:hypothetical protein